MARENIPLPLNEAEVLNSLSKIIDPDFNLDIVNLGLVYEVRFPGTGIEMDLTMTDPACPIIDQIVAAVKAVLSRDFGLRQESVVVNVVWSPRWTWEMMTDEAKIAMGFAI